MLARATVRPISEVLVAVPRRSPLTSGPSSSASSLVPAGREKRGKFVSAGVGLSAASSVISAAPAPAVGSMNQTANEIGHYLDALLSDLDALLSDLDSIVTDITAIITEVKHHRWLH